MLENETPTRHSGILLHVTSLPSGYGIGDLGPEAYRFADFLAETGQSLWQMLPLTPTDPASGHSPYSGASAFAGNRLLVSPELLAEDGLLTADEVRRAGVPASERIDYAAASAGKDALLEAAFTRRKSWRLDSDYGDFCRSNAWWLDDYAAFAAFKAHFDSRDWGAWPGEIRLRERPAVEALKARLADRIDRERFTQFIFARQWARLKRYCNGKGIRIVGDLPIYISYDSADAWSNPEIFNWTPKGIPP